MIEPETLAFIGTSDLSGLLRGVSVPWAALEGVLERGVVLPGHVPSMAPRDGVVHGAADLLLLPDPATRAYIPAEGAPDIVLLLGDLLELDGAPWACCPRYFLRRGLAALHAEFGLTVRAGFTQAFSVVGAKPGRSFAAARAQAAMGGRLLAAMRGNGLVPEAMHPGDAAGVFEVGAAATIGVSAADQAVVLRALIESVSAGALGDVRIGVGLVDRFGQSAMGDASGEHGLSDEAEHYVAGLVHHLPALARRQMGRAGDRRATRRATAPQ
jgi:glutamine synthetase